MKKITLRVGDIILDKMTGNELVVYGFWRGVDPVANGERYRASGYGLLWEKTGDTDLEEALHQQRKFMKFDLDRWCNEADQNLSPEALMKQKIAYREQFLAKSISFEHGLATPLSEDPA